MKFKPPSKRQKVDQPPISSSNSRAIQTTDISPVQFLYSNRTSSLCNPNPQLTDSRAAELNLMKKSTVHEIPNANVNLRIQQARNFAVAQAQQDNCTANFRVFDSPFGNYLVPVIPTRAELGG